MFAGVQNNNLQSGDSNKNGMSLVRSRTQFKTDVGHMERTTISNKREWATVQIFHTNSMLIRASTSSSNCSTDPGHHLHTHTHTHTHKHTLDLAVLSKQLSLSKYIPVQGRGGGQGAGETKAETERK